MMKYQNNPTYQKNYRAKNRELLREYSLMRKYGVTIEQYNQLFANQNGVCAICGKPETTVNRKGAPPRRLSVDHSHATGKVRGLLCRGCNQGIGNFQEDEQRMSLAIQYLRSQNVR